MVRSAEASIRKRERDRLRSLIKRMEKEGWIIPDIVKVTVSAERHRTSEEIRHDVAQYSVYHPFIANNSKGIRGDIKLEGQEAYEYATAERKYNEEIRRIDLSTRAATGQPQKMLHKFHWGNVRKEKETGRATPEKREIEMQKWVEKRRRILHSIQESPKKQLAAARKRYRDNVKKSLYTVLVEYQLGALGPMQAQAYHQMYDLIAEEIDHTRADVLANWIEGHGKEFEDAIFSSDLRLIAETVGTNPAILELEKWALEHRRKRLKIEKGDEYSGLDADTVFDLDTAENTITNQSVRNEEVFGKGRK